MPLPSLTVRAPVPLTPYRATRRGLAGLLDRLLLWQERTNARQQLREMDPHLLRDIGLGRSAADPDRILPYLRD